MNKWLKFVGISVAVLLGIAAVTGIVLAQGPGDNGTSPVGPLDEDGDGVCDECGAEIGAGSMRGWRFSQEGEEQPFGRGRSDGNAFIDEDNDGVCDEFVDEDADGVCDVCGEETGAGSMRGWRFSQEGEEQPFGRGQSDGNAFIDEDGDGVCDEFVDENGDGVCDECGAAAFPQGRQGGRMGGRIGGRAGGRQNTP